MEGREGARMRFCVRGTKGVRSAWMLPPPLPPPLPYPLLPLITTLPVRTRAATARACCSCVLGRVASPLDGRRKSTLPTLLFFRAFREEASVDWGATPEVPVVPVPPPPIKRRADAAKTARAAAAAGRPAPPAATAFSRAHASSAMVSLREDLFSLIE